MNRPHLSITALPAWSKLNDVNFLDISVEDLGSDKGYGLVTSRALNSKNVYDVPTLLTVPKDLVLGTAAIEEHAKVDAHFKQLLDAFGGKSTRVDVMLFLLMQVTIASHPDGKTIGLSNPWTEYVKLLPDNIPVPTLWTEEERMMLVGTSLETAVNAKMASMLREYEGLRDVTIDIPWCKICWWDNESFQLKDWLLLDAWYRSRCLELPQEGEVMIPLIDMVNHAADANAYYEPTPEGVVLLLRPDVKLDVESEVTISYGTSKSEAEMLFNYGFIDSESTKSGLTLSLEPFPNDPLGKAKVAAFAGPPIIRITQVREDVTWQSPFLYFLCLNEEDGLEFRVLQQIDGSRSPLMVFWQGLDITDKTDELEVLTSDHDLSDVFKLRAVALLQDCIHKQLGRLYESEDIVQAFAEATLVTPQSQGNALRLRKSEIALLEKTFAAVDVQKILLIESETVQRYLGSMDHEDRPEPSGTNEDDDFS